MKKSLSTILEKMDHRDNLFKLFRTDSFSSIEIISDETAELVRGGDREYVPIYESEESNSVWQRPTILLNI